MVTKKEIQKMLREFKALIRQDKWTFVERRVNLQGLVALGLTVPQAKAEIIGLSYRHYDRGPEADRDRDGDFIWEFIKRIGAQKVYIKLKIDNRGCVCLSFHRSVGPTTLPFKALRPSILNY